MRAHAKSDAHIRYSEAEVLAAKAEKEGSILQQLRSITEEQRIKNRKGIKALLRCTHFIARNHIPHTTKKFAALVDLIVTCGEDLKQFTERCARNATYTSTDTISDFLEALGLWVEEFQLKHLCKAPFCSDGDESTDIATIEVLSLFFRWAEDGETAEHFFDIIPLKKADAASIYTTLTDWFKQKGILSLSE